MPLPTDANQVWPPRGVRDLHREMRTHRAWWSGDTDQLRRIYSSGGGGYVDEVDRRRPGLMNTVRNFFWGSKGVQDPLGGTSRIQVHVPLAGDICATSADLLFGEPAEFTIADAEEGAGDNGTRTEATAAQDRLDELIDEAGVHNILLEMSELCAAVGGAYLRPAWDPDLADHPLLTAISADEAVPEFSFGVLTAVTFWRELQGTDARTYRHLERYEKGVILHGLYESSNPDALGTKIPLSEHPETQALARSLTDGDEIRVEDFDDLFVRYVPNVRPNRRHKGYQGRSDLQGIEDLLDALDETYTSWMRDIRLGKARVIVARDFLENIPARPELGAAFNVDREVFTPVEMDAITKNEKPIEKVQFDIRTQEHLDTAIRLREEAVTNAGYSAQTFMPRHEGQPESGAALRQRERRSFQTLGKKQRYVRSPVAEVLEIMLFLDNAIFNRKTPVLRPGVSFSDAAGESPRDIGGTVQILRSAQAASIQTGVEMVHPDWSTEEVEAEVKRILDEEKGAVPDLIVPGDQG